MKEIVTSWIILIAIVSLFAINSYVVKNVSFDICDELKTAQQAVESENFAVAEKTIFNIKQNWNKSSKKIIHIFPHTQIEEIGRIIILAQQHIKEKDLNNSVLRLKEIEYLVKILEEHEKITLDNIF